MTAKPKPRQKTITFAIRIPETVVRALEELAGHGLFGATASDVARQLLATGIRGAKEQIKRLETT